MKRLIQQFLRLSYGLLLLTAGACNDFFHVEIPRNQLVTAGIFADDGLANGAVAGIYQEMMINSTHFAGGGTNSVTALMGLASDELSYNLTTPDILDVAQHQWDPENTAIYSLWASAYKSIYRANEVLEGLEASKKLSPDLVGQLRGEALFVRGFCHFYVSQLFGAVPVALTSDYRITASLPRSAEGAVYAQVGKDLQEASELLPADYSHAMGERVRPNKWAAKQLLARVYLYQNKWTDAAAAASEVIGQTGQYDLIQELDEVFLKNSQEAVWQLMAVDETGINTNEGFEAAPVEIVDYPPSYSLTDGLLNTFETGDARREHWVKRYTAPTDLQVYQYPFKYKIWQDEMGAEKKEYSMVLRLAECYLIRAEALTQTGDLTGASADVNALRVKHGGLAPLSGLDRGGLMAEIERERFVEFFYEWGHRWFDGKRWGRNTKLLPVPQKEIEADPFLTQNDDYK